MAYASVIIEGGLFPAELLERIAVGEIGDAPGPAGGGRITAVTETAFSESVRHWRSWQARLSRSRLSPTRLTRDDWMRKLLEILDYDDLQPQTAALSAAGRNFPIYATAGAGPDAPPVHLVGHHQPLDRRDGPGRRSPHALVQEYLNHSDALWGLVSNGEQLRLLRNSARFTRPTYLEFNLRGLMDGNQYAEFVLLYRLLHRSRLPQNGQPPNHCPLEQYYQHGLDLHGRVRERLREGVEAALIALGNGFLQHPESGALRESLAPAAGGPPRLSPLAYYRQLLRLVYRLLFLMTAEERGMLAPADNREAARKGYAIYQEYYSAANLRRRADRPLAGPADGGPSDASDLWPGLRQTFAIFRDDELAGKLGLNALNGELFRPNACADLESAACRNRELLAAVRDLSTFRDDGHVRRPVNYAAIDVEEFGSVYESLLDFHPRITPPPAPQFHLVAGAERKQTGSYYTPPELVRELIDSVLTPVMDETTAAAQSDADKAAALLSLKVCDPAAGSGHFLLAAARRIAARVARLQSGEAEPAPEAYRAALRQTIRNCIYAVDQNPFAVDLCKVVLWIEGHEPGLPLSFLDHRIKHGDSLVGVANPDTLKAGIPNEAYKPIAGDDKTAAAQYRRRNAKELRGQLPLSPSEPAALDAITAQSQELANMPDDSARQVDQKQAQYHANRGPETDWWAQKVACDLWAAAFFIPKQTSGPLVPTTDHLRRFVNELGAIDGRIVGAAVDASDQNGFFHWPLEFPEVFASGGFDVVLGNPPWGQKRMAENHAVAKFIRSNYQSVAGIFDWFRPFVEKGLSLLRNGGRYGLVLPDTVLLKDYETTRRRLLENTAIQSITWWGTAFASATIDVVTIAGIRGLAPKDHSVKVAVRDPLNPLSHEIRQEDFWTNPRLTFNLHLTQEKRKAIKSLQKYPAMGDFFEIHEGVHSGNIRAQLFVSEKTDSSCRPVIVKGREISPYRLDWDGTYIRIDAVPPRKTPKAYANLGKRDWHEQDKLLVQRTGDRIIAAVDREKRFSSNNFFIVFPKRCSALELDGLCAMLNSNPMTWLFRTIEPREGRAFAELKIKHLEQFPLPLLADGSPSDADGVNLLNSLGRERVDLAAAMGYAESRAQKPVQEQRRESLDKQIDLVVKQLLSLE